MSKEILVIGATGLLGKPVAVQLKNDGFGIRVFTRNFERAKSAFGPDFKFFEGDVCDTGSLIAASSGCYGIHINLASSSFRELKNIEYAGMCNIIDAAIFNRVSKISWITGLGFTGQNSWSGFIKYKLLAEKELVKCGIPYSIFACTHFMDSIPMYKRLNRLFIIGNQIHKIHFVASEDYAKMVSKSFQTKKADNKKFEVLGPEAYTFEEAFNKYRSIINPSIHIVKLPLVLLKIWAYITFNGYLKLMSQLMHFIKRVPEKADTRPTKEILGNPEITYEMWLNKT